MTRPLLLLVVVAALGCAEPTTLLVELSLGPGEPSPSSLTVRLFDRTGAVAAPLDVAAPRLPGTVVVSRLAASRRALRIAVDGGAVRAATTVETQPGQQVKVALVLAASAADSDADGVPDSVDNCATTRNADQADADADGTGNACQTGPDGGSDLAGTDLAGDGAIVVPSCVTAGAVAFCDDFESSTLDQMKWDNNLGVIDTAFAHRGQHSVFLRGPMVAVGTDGGRMIVERQTFNPPVGDTFYVRGWYFIPQPPVGMNSVRLVAIEQATTPFEGMGIFVHPAHVEVDNWMSGASAVSATPPVWGAWACYELRIVLSTGPDGVVALTGENVPAVAPVMARNQSLPTIGAINFGPYLYMPGTAQPEYDMWIDDIIIDDKPVGCMK